MTILVFLSASVSKRRSLTRHFSAFKSLMSLSRSSSLGSQIPRSISAKFKYRPAPTVLAPLGRCGRDEGEEDDGQHVPADGHGQDAGGRQQQFLGIERDLEGAEEPRPGRQLFEGVLSQSGLILGHAKLLHTWDAAAPG